MSYKGNDLKDRLYRFYYIYQKDKLDDIDGLVTKYKAQEAKLFEKLVEKYGKEPTIEEFEKAVNAASPAKSAAAKDNTADGAASSKSSETKAKSSQAKSSASSSSAGAKASSASKKESPLDKYSPRSRLTRFYTKYAPDKLGDIEKFLAKIESDPKQENLLFQMLIKKYGPEPEVEGDEEDDEDDGEEEDDDNDDNDDDEDDDKEDDEDEEEEEDTGRAKGAKALSKNAKLVKSLKGKKGNDANENDENRPSIIKDIEYCPVNGLPAEYCEFSPASFQQSLPWLAENYPDMVLLSQKKATVTEYIHKLAETHKLNKDSFPSLSDLAAALPSKGGAAAVVPASDGSATAASATDAKATKKGKGAKEKVVLIEATQRQKRKFVTTITGLDLFDDIKIKDAAKLLGKKFACGATVTEEAGKKFIEVQGDITYDVPDFIVDVFKISKDALFLVEKGTKSPAFAENGKVKIKASGKKKDSKPAQTEENNEDKDE